MWILQLLLIIVGVLAIAALIELHCRYTTYKNLKPIYDYESEQQDVNHDN